MRKIVYSMAPVLLLTACISETKGKSQEQSATEQEVMGVNENMLGKWQGAIDIPQIPLEVILNLQQDTCTLTVPAQGLSDLLFKSVEYDDGQLNSTIDAAGSLGIVKVR